MSVERSDLSQTATEARFRDFLDAHLDQELLRFTTAGSVDDGKSTLIGRLLHDTKSVYEDQLASIRASKVNRSGGAVDLSLLTDGLRAEREQGITIDVAYRYFSTSRRKFIIADTPGHEQYTRNMATGASTADVAIVLIDAAAYLKHGTLLPQSRRHTYIASLLGIPHVVAAVNKMDIVAYDEGVFTRIRDEFLKLGSRLDLRSLEVIPVSALEGTNVVDRSHATPWYSGPTLLEYLETVPLTSRAGGGSLRFPVQLVSRPDSSFRGFAGRVEAGTLSPGLSVRALPSGRVTQVRSIITYDGELNFATAPQSVTVELADEIDLSRGDMLIAADGSSPAVATRVRAVAVWMEEQPLAVGMTCLLKQTTRIVRATVRAIRYRVDINTSEHVASQTLAMNDIGEVELETNLPLFFDPYRENRATGSFILIDQLSNATLAAGMLLGTAVAPSDASEQSPHFVLARGEPAILRDVQSRLEMKGQRSVIVDDPLIPESSLPAVVRALQLAGVVGLSERSLQPDTLQALREIAGAGFVDSPHQFAQLLEER